MVTKTVQTVRASCRFCNKQIWAQADNKEPECEECGDLASAIITELCDVEETFHPLTEWQWWEM